MSVSCCTAEMIRRDADYERLKEYVLGETGLAYYADRDAEFASRVSVRLSKLGRDGLGGYLELLLGAGAGEEELDRLIEELAIGETHFFRHQELFDALERIVAPSLFGEGRSGEVRIWSAGCSIGAEAYSVAITLKEAVGYEGSRRAVSILGTDIDRSALHRARRGEYTEWDLRGTPAPVRRACFVRRNGSWAIRPEYQEGVAFRYHNLVRHAFPSLVTGLFAFDLILCRNVLIYFDAPTCGRVVDQLYASLNEKGWLLVGHAEPNAELFSSFRTIQAPGAVLYQKDAEAAEVAMPPTQVVAGGVAPPAVRSTGERACTETRRRIPPAAPRERGMRTTDRESQLRGICVAGDHGDLGAVESRCRQWMVAEPLDPAPYLYLALVAEQRGRVEEALQLLRKSLYLDRSLVVGHYHLGSLLRRTGDLSGARLAYENAERLLSAGDEDLVPYSGGFTVEDFRRLLTLELAEVNG